MQNSGPILKHEGKVAFFKNEPHRVQKAGHTLERARVRFFRKRAKKNVKKSKRGQHIWKCGQNYTEFENILKKGRLSTARKGPEKGKIREKLSQNWIKHTKNWTIFDIFWKGHPFGLAYLTPKKFRIGIASPYCFNNFSPVELSSGRTINTPLLWSFKVKIDFLFRKLPKLHKNRLNVNFNEITSAFHNCTV